MPIRDNREYRIAMPFQAVGDEDSMIVEGYATTFDEPYVCEGTEINELIPRSAMDTADMSDVIFQYDHDGEVMARTRNRTLQLECDNHGLHIRADLSGCQKGRELYESIKNGLVDRMSWGFMVPDDAWEYDVESNTRTITKVGKVYDVSAVSIPANQGTDIYARSAFDGAVEAARKELSERAAKAEREKREKLALLVRMES